MFNASDNVCVACSGGKDSTTALYLVKKFVGDKGKVSALLIDEGIAGYREHTVKDLMRFCMLHKIPLRSVSFQKEFGSTLDAILKSGKAGLKPCTVCGALRRYLLNKHARGFDCIVTGHNLDDESQAIVMNLLKQHIDVLSRLGPVTGVAKHRGFVRRVKPLYFCPEKEVAIYSLLMGFGVSFNECPYTNEAYRGDVRQLLNSYEALHKGTKLNIVRHFLSLSPGLKKSFAGSSPVFCVNCGEPSSNDVCNVCVIVKKICG